MSFISQTSVLIYCYQTAFLLMCCYKGLSSLSKAIWGEHEVRLISLACLIRYVSHHTNNLLHRTHWVFNVYSQVIWLQREGKVEWHHQCFINSELWIFQQPRGSSNASQVNLREVCCELDCVVVGCLTCTQSPSHKFIYTSFVSCQRAVYTF